MKQNLFIKKLNYLLLPGLLLFVIGPVAFGQKTDTLTILRDFITISNAYKQMPLHLDLEMTNRTNFVTGGEDTSSTRAEFYLSNSASYVKLGEFEQVVNDSTALLISDKLQRMILYTNASLVINQMKAMIGMQVADSSLRRLSDKYISSVSKLSPETMMIQLRSRDMMYGTSSPKEVIEMQYDLLKKQPLQVRTMKRYLLSLDSLQYEGLEKDRKDLSQQLFKRDNNYFLIKEQESVFIYKKIEQTGNLKIPVIMADRIRKTEEDRYVPIGKYENYMLSQN